jgi:thioredoxin-related protein
MNLHIKIVVFISVLVFTSGLKAQEAHINWMSIAQAQEAMKKEPKKVMIDVYTNWCGPCKMMMKNTFTDPTIIAYINENYYAVKFNAEGNQEVNFKGNTYSNPNFNPAKTNSRNGTHEFTMAIAPVNGRVAYPTIVYMDESFNILTPVQGYHQPAQIMPILSYFGDNAYKTMDFQTFQTSYGK